MRFTTSIIALCAAGLAHGVPVVEERAKVTDADLLNYALTLEHLESAFYSQGLAKYPKKDFTKLGFGDAFYNNLKKIAEDEATHVAFISKALKDAGATPVQPCTYDFGHKDAKSFLATAAVLEGVGVAAYLGAAASIAEKAYLTAAGAILTVESRHASYLRGRLNQAPFPEPLDNPLTPNEVHSLAVQYIKKCPASNPKLPIKAFPKLSVAKSTKLPLKVGGTITLEIENKNIKPTGKVYAAFALLGGPVFLEAKPVKGGFSVQIPDGFSGQQYVLLTKSQKVTDDTVIAGPAILEI